MPDQELRHHGIKGMRWGVRRFQNRDGSLTAAGRKQYDVGAPRKKTKSKSNSTITKLKKSYKEHQKIAAKKKKIRVKAKKDADKLKQKAALEQYKIDQEKKYREKAKVSLKEDSKDHKTSKEDISKLTNEELKRTVERLELERKYKELTTPKATNKQSKGKEFLQKQASTMASAALSKVSNALVDKWIADNIKGGNQNAAKAAVNNMANTAKNMGDTAKKATDKLKEAAKEETKKEEPKPKSEPETKKKPSDDIIDADFEEIKVEPKEEPWEPNPYRPEITGGYTRPGLPYDPRKKKYWE